MKTRNEELASLADRLLPYLLPVVRQTAQAGGGAGTASLTQHALDGGFHTGTLSWSRVNKAGSSLADMATRNYADLTNRAHVLATNAGLGPDHTISGATAGHVLRASGSAAAAFAQLQHGDLGGVGPNDHHNRQHGITSASDHTVTGSSWDVIALTGTNVLGVRTPVADTTAGTLEALLKSNASGGLELVFLDSAELRNNAGSITLNPTGTAVLPTGTIQKDLGDYNRKWRTIYGAELYVETLVAQSVISTIGGRVLVTPTSSLIADIASGTGTSITIDVKHNGFAVNEWLYMAAAPGGVAQVEVFQVTAGPTTITGGYRYTVNRNQDGSGQNAWQAGDAVASLGNALGTGYLDLSATTTTRSHIGPTITVYSRTSTGAWTGVTPVVSMGNLRSFVDYGSNEYGFGLGNDLTLLPTSGFSGMTADRTNGLRMFNTNIALYSGASTFLTINTTTGISIASSTTGLANQRAVTFFDGADTIGGLWSNHVASGQIDVTLGAGYGATTRATNLTLLVAGGTQTRTITLNANGASITVQRTAGGANTVAISGSSGVSVVGQATFTNGLVSSAASTFNSSVAFANSTVTILGNTVWHAGNDGAGTGLHADLLDGYHAASFALLAGAAFSGAVSVAGTFTASGAISSSYGAGYNLSMSNGNGIHFASGNVGNIYRAGGILYMYVDAGQAMTLRDSGGGSNLYVRIGSNTDLYGARLQVTGNVHATGAVTGELYFQTAAGTVPGAATGWARIALRSSDNALVAVMPSGAVRVLATN